MSVGLPAILKLSLAALMINTLIQGSVASTGAQDQNWVSKRAGIWTWTWSEDSASLEISIRGHLEFNEDYSGIQKLGPGSSLEIREKRSGVTRRLEIRDSSGGGLEISYFVDGQGRPYDSAAKTWLALVLQRAVQSGLDAGPRARKIISERGPGALLDEVSRLRGDHVKYLYISELFNSGKLDRQITQQVLAIVSREIGSDHYKARLLVRAAENSNEVAGHSGYIEAARTIRSDHYRAQTLEAILASPDLSPESLVGALAAAGEISSDHYAARVLSKVGNSFLDDRAVTSAYMQAAATIGSDHYRGRVLSTLLERPGLSKEALLAVVKTSTTISSDHYKARVLLKAAAGHSNDAAIRDAIVEAARAIKSDHERGRVLSAVFK